MSIPPYGRARNFDRATVAAVAAIQIVELTLSSGRPIDAARPEVVGYLRDQFDEVQQQTMSDIRLTD
jgi:hypothetical protein